MPVYLIRAGENGPVKIGHTTMPQKRLYELQTAHWERLKIIRLFEGGEEEEAALHLRFADLHIRGEWHSFSRLMLSDVGLVEIVPEAEAAPAAIPVARSTKLADYRSANKLTIAGMAALLGVHHSTVLRLEAGQINPGAALVRKIIRVTGGEVTPNDLFITSQETAA